MLSIALIPDTQPGYFIKSNYPYPGANDLFFGRYVPPQTKKILYDGHFIPKCDIISLRNTKAPNGAMPFLKPV